MNFPKLLLPVLAAACLGGCVYEEYETGYQQPSRVYHGGYARREVVVARPARYYDDRPRVQAYDDEPYYEERPRVHYDRRPEPRYYQQPRPYVSGAVVHHDNYRETADERRRREIREAQRRAESRKKDKDKDKKKDDDKKDDDDRKKRKRGD